VGQYILDAIHKLAEQLNEKQDCLINCKERTQAIEARDKWMGRKWGVINLQIYWILGHRDFEPNKCADEEDKKAAQGESSNAKSLPSFLHKCLPLSVSALHQENSSKLSKHWERRWKTSPRETLLKSIDNTAPSKKYLRLIKNLDHRQASILFQLQSIHISLNQHLFCIRKSETPPCPHCQGITVESVKHFLLECPQYVRERHELQTKLQHNSNSLSFLLSSPVAVLPLLKCVHATGQFKSFCGKDISEKIHTNSRRNAELCSAAKCLESLLSNCNTRNANHT
jgi:hypothetical protein